ncbi:fungal hydrophobin [Artomyces pyxidatus]|uniref:Fungal hydrophobin n=1 Tax=Artomyces pyxidatus TaxID=48021 RepID=A0ACB8T9R9_9AGAM|nr:fungal hydrophobin [Artomyces pyxidatus]
MFSRLAVIFVYALIGLAVLSAAKPAPWGAPTTTPPVTTTTTVTVTAPPVTTTLPVNSCTTGPVQCCNTVESASNPVVSIILGLLGIVLDGVDVIVGITCTPINIIGIGGNSCTAQTVCCENNNFSGIISIGCSPISI